MYPIIRRLQNNDRSWHGWENGGVLVYTKSVKKTKGDTNMNTLNTYFKGNKKTIYMVLIIVGLLTIYPPIFQTIYQAGSDFGRSFVNAVLP